jgi:hypothetical protein
MKTYISLCLILLFSANAQAGMASSKEDLDLQIALENQFNNKLNIAYPDIRVAVSVDLKKEKTMQLDIIGGVASIPNHDKSVAEQIEIVKVYSDEPIESEKISELLEIPVTEIKFVQLVKFVKPTPAAVIPASAEPLTWLQKIRESTASYYHAIVTLGIVLALSIAGILIFSIFNIGASIQAAAKNLFQNMKSSSGESVSPNAHQNKVEAAAPISAAISQRKWSAHQLKAIFSECYWTEQDEAAAALVQNYPGEEYLELSFGAEYLTYLRHVKPGSLAILEDPYFTTPHPIFFNLSVADTPAYLYHECSQSRFDALQCSAVDMIRAQNSDRKKKDTQMLQASALRNLPSSIRVRFKNTDEEDQILTSAEFNEETKLALPSLYCLQQLNDEQFNQVINQITVSELAEAWTGPAWLITQISSRLPERKREVLQQIEKTVTPSRQSRGFQKILSLCKPHYVKTDDQSREQAAA